MRLQKLAQFLRFFSSFSFSCRTLTKTANATSDYLEIWHTEGGYKGASRYQLWLEYDKQAKSYERLFMKNNTNMLSRLQGKPRMGRS